MVVCVENGRVWVIAGQVLRIGLTVSIVAGATVDGEVGGLVDKCSGLGISAHIGGGPEGTTEVYRPEIVRIWSRYLSVPNNNITDKCVRTDVGEDTRFSAGTTVVSEAREIVVANRREVTLHSAPARVGVGAEPGSVSVRVTRDTGEVRVSLGGIILCVGSGGVDLRSLVLRAGDERSPFVMGTRDG